MDVPISLPYRDWIVVTSALARAAEVTPDSNYSRVHDALMEKMFAQAEPAKTEPLNDALIMPDLVYAVDLRAISPTVSTRIQMTKEVRAMTQLGLKEAKDFVDHLVGNPQQWFTSSELARVPGERLRRAAMPRDFEGKVTKVS